MRILNDIARCLLFCLAAGVFASCVTEDDPEFVGLGVGDSLPSFTVTLSDGTVVTSLAPEAAPAGAVSLAGKRVLVELFNTTCPDCQESLPVINDVYLSMKDEPDVFVFAIAREEEGAELAAYWDENRLSLPYSPQPDRSVYELFANTGIPRIYITSTSGTITSAFGPNDSPTLSTLLHLLR